MPRPLNPDLRIPWKISMPATLAGRVEWLLMSPIHGKPIYSSRGKLIIALLERWVAEQSGNENLPEIPSLTELRGQPNA